ncbi:hypothetical protein MNBD_GAMMA01-1545 [hydrothermal vent metagenome]|uniref:YdhG-like domain-containing protein n=1 Tax=hydrothermal vent metagenome TaxID=652676 RepID=A0A3B0VJL4_9ZZZZ
MLVSIEDAEVQVKFDSYPEKVRKKILFIRNLIYEIAKENEAIGAIEESLKWGEPSYSSKLGSSVRIDWKRSKPSQYCVFFHCKTKLVDTFKEIYGDIFDFEGNRAIILNLGDVVPKDELKHCIALSLNYHRIKNLPLLGV